MKIRNRTLWRTDHLRAILQRAAEQELEPAQRKVAVVTVVYTRGVMSSGCAFLGGRHATIRIRHPSSRRTRWVQVPLDDPRPGHGGTWKDGVQVSKTVADRSPRPLTDGQRRELVLRVASVAVHEFAHLRGMRHEQMPACYKWSGRWREYVAWAADLPLDVQPPAVRVKPSVADKLAHVLRMKAVAETRVKRATTILRKWKQRERYYRQAAQRAERG
jgi:hypothetical protein